MNGRAPIRCSSSLLGGTLAGPDTDDHRTCVPRGRSLLAGIGDSPGTSQKLCEGRSHSSSLDPQCKSLRNLCENRPYRSGTMPRPLNGAFSSETRDGAAKPRSSGPPRIPNPLILKHNRCYGLLLTAAVEYLVRLSALTPNTARGFGLCPPSTSRRSSDESVMRRTRRGSAGVLPPTPPSHPGPPHSSARAAETRPPKLFHSRPERRHCSWPSPWIR